jgi:orotate phosphoribosyltransferase
MALTVPELDSTILDYLKGDRLLREGHFEYPSGRHSGVQINHDRLLADPQAASRMGYAMAKAFFTQKVQTVAAPSIWGAGLAQWVAYFLEPRAKVAYATPRRDGTRRIAPNLAGLIEGRRVLLVDNVTLSGDTMLAFADEVRRMGGEVIGIGCLWAGAEPSVQAEVFGLLNARYPVYDPIHCPLCQDGHGPVEIVGH